MIDQPSERETAVAMLIAEPSTPMPVASGTETLAFPLRLTGAANSLMAVWSIRTESVWRSPTQTTQYLFSPMSMRKSGGFERRRLRAETAKALSATRMSVETFHPPGCGARRAGMSELREAVGRVGKGRLLNIAI